MTDDNKKELQVDNVLRGAISRGASDIHFVQGRPPILRIQGNLEPLPTYPVDNISQIVNSLLVDKKRQELFDNQNVDASYPPNMQFGEGYRFRVNVAYENQNPYVTLRVIPNEIIPVEEIGFPMDVWNEIVSLQRGLVLVTGVTGSGKTTTLASLIQKINEEQRKRIVTIEDPVEYMFNDVNSVITQRELGIDVSSFSDGVKYSLRQDPDIIMVGEIRDLETAYRALEAASTGHLVFSTLHTKDASSSVQRYANMFPADQRDDARDLLAANLAYVLSQQLIPYQKGEGRTLAMEVMNSGDSSGIQNHIREAKDHQIASDIQTGKKLKMITMDQCLYELCEGGKITGEMAITYSYSKEGMRKRLREQ